MHQRHQLLEILAPPERAQLRILPQVLQPARIIEITHPVLLDQSFNELSRKGVIPKLAILGVFFSHGITGVRNHWEISRPEIKRDGSLGSALPFVLWIWLGLRKEVRDSVCHLQTISRVHFHVNI